MLKNNKGFSLVELIVSMAIAAIAGLAIFGFVNYSTGTYYKSDQEVKLQYEQQIIVNQIKDILFKSTNGISYDDVKSTLTVYNQVYNKNEYYVYKIRFDAPNETLYIGKKKFNNKADINSSAVACTEVLSKQIKNFSVDLSKIKKNKVNFAITFKSDEKEMTTSSLIVLRNHIVASDDVTKLYEEDGSDVKSYLTGVSISRDGNVFSAGVKDEIGKYGDVVSVQYSANVEKTEDSTGDESVIWSLSEVVPGVLLNEDNGTVTVTKDVPTGTVFTLQVNCLSDPDIKNSLEITVVDSYPYPIKATLRQKTADKQNGYTNVTLVPTLSYASGKEDSSVLDLFDFKGDVTKLPIGCSLDSKTGILTLVESANDQTFKIWVASKEKGTDGKVILSNYVEVKAGIINPYKEEPKITISADNKLDRGSSTTIYAKWTNLSNPNCDYKWKVEPVSNEDGKNYWVIGDENDLNSFDNINYKMEQYNKGSKIQLFCNQNLNWNRTFCVKVSIEAFNHQTGKLIDTDEINVSIDPVKVTLNPEWWDGSLPIYPNYYVMEPHNNSFIIYDARIFRVNFENLVLSNSHISYSVRNIYTFYNANGKFVTTSSPPTLLYDTISRTNNYVGFKIPRNDWKNDANKVTSFDYGVVISSDDVNSVKTTVMNKKTFKVVYQGN